MELRKLKEDATTITLGWDPVPGCEGYLFFKDGKRVSRSLDPKRSSVRFSKPGTSYGVQAVVYQAIAGDTYPDTAPPPPPPPPPPPAYVKVAPRVANKVLPGGSDARYCVENQPGVVWTGSEYVDESGATYDSDGLCKNGLRSPDLQVPGLTMANDINGRPYCSLPTVGDPTKNTGSWAI